jgi:hypothetical protein
LLGEAVAHEDAEELRLPLLPWEGKARRHRIVERVCDEINRRRSARAG